MFDTVETVFCKYFFQVTICNRFNVHAQPPIVTVD